MDQDIASTFYKDDALTRTEYDVLGASTMKLNAFKNSQTKRFIGEGFNRRLLMMQSSHIRIREKTRPPHKKLLDHHLATELGTHVNGYYINLRGSLDNLAWALIFELALKSPADENNPKTRRYCDLLGRDFLSDLKQKDANLAGVVEGRLGWGINLKEFRDPAAHRIPLYIPPGVMAGQDLDKFKRLDDLASKSEEERGGRSRYEILMEARSLARFEPVLVASTAAGLRQYSLPGQLAQDHKTFLEIAGAIVSSL